MSDTAILKKSWAAGAFTLVDAQQALRTSGWKVSGDPHRRIVAEHGSRIRLRLLGVLFKSTRNRMPVRISVTDNGTEIVAEAYPNPGFYLFSVNLSELYASNARSGIEALDELATA